MLSVRGENAEMSSFCPAMHSNFHICLVTFSLHAYLSTIVISQSAELPKYRIWGNVRCYPLTALCNSWACVRVILLQGRKVPLIGNKTVCLLCPLLLIMKLQLAQRPPHQSNPCWRTILCSLIYDYLHVQNDQIVTDLWQTDVFGHRKTSYWW